MKNKMLVGLFAVFLISLVAFAGITYAYKGNANVKGPNYSEEVHDQIEAAIEAGDYDAWVKARQDNNLPMTGRMFQVINADNFDKYVALHNAMEAGDTKTADSIRAELGLGQGMKKGTGTGTGMHSGKQSGNGLSAGTGSGNYAGSTGAHDCSSCPLNK